MVGLFVVQLFAVGFCLMAPQTDAMPMAMEISHSADMVAEHCDEPMDSQADVGRNHTACMHCDQPDELFKSYRSRVDFNRVLLALVQVEIQDLTTDKFSLILTSLVPMGPPRSSSLIYNITKRILI
jgi:hypothetical protein